MRYIPTVVSKTLGRNGLLLEKHSPTILFGAGVVGMIGSTVLACRATLKLDEVLEKSKKTQLRVSELQHVEYSEQDRSRDMAIVYVQTTVNVARLYAPAVILGGASIAALAQSHSLLTRRNAALGAAYAAVEKGFSEYRQRVVDKYGEEEDRNLRYGTREDRVLNEQTGKKETVVRVGSDIPSVYARFFDESSPSWRTEPEINLLFLNCQQNYANDLLHSRGHIFLNEVYDMLGIGRSQAGAVVGWIMSPDGTDNYVDFGVFDPDNNNARDFVNGLEGSILLDFNVDGVIYDKIDNPRRINS